MRARTVCRDPDCWCGLEGGARSPSGAFGSWPRLGLDVMWELLRRGYVDHRIVDVHLPD